MSPKGRASLPGEAGLALAADGMCGPLLLSLLLLHTCFFKMANLYGGRGKNGEAAHELCVTFKRARALPEGTGRATLAPPVEGK